MATKFTEGQNAQLSAPLMRENVKTRAQSGRSLSYIEGWHAIAEANRIFGFDGWMRETVDLKCVAEKDRKIGREKADGWGVTYTARVRVTVGDIIREGCGTGHGIDRDLGQAHESALKEAETDAMKRAFMTFGNPFGLALYDKTQANVSDSDGDETPAENWPLMLPGNPEPYSVFGCAEAWLDGLKEMVARIQASTKYKDAEKQEKLTALFDANKAVTAKLDEKQSAEFMKIK